MDSGFSELEAPAVVARWRCHEFRLCNAIDVARDCPVGLEMWVGPTSLHNYQYMFPAKLRLPVQHMVCQKEIPELIRNP